jgi:hypothetical protein
MPQAPASSSFMMMPGSFQGGRPITVASLAAPIAWIMVSAIW